MRAKDFNESAYSEWKFTTTLYLIKLSDGGWKVTNTVTQERFLETTGWETKQVYFTAIEKDVEEALSRSWVDTAQYLSSVEHDLFEESANESASDEVYM